MKYYKHKENNVYCSVYGNIARFSKWKWSGNSCQEDVVMKSISDNFYDSFVEVTKEEFNNDWGNKLEKA